MKGETLWVQICGQIKKIYIGANYNHNKITGTIDLKKDNKPIDIELSKIKYILQEQAQWNKAYQIYDWFQDKLGDINDYSEIYGQDLLELVDLCNQVLANNDLADELLPCDVDEYDEYYFEQLRSTIKQLKDIDPDAWYEYSVSW